MIESYTRGPRDKSLLAMTIGEALDATVAAYPQREALVVCHQNLRYTWAELAAGVLVVARALLMLGLKPGERLGIWAPNCAQWCIAQLASAKVGAILVNINPAYRSSELEYGGWGAMELKTNVSRIRVRFTRQRLRINEL